MENNVKFFVAGDTKAPQRKNGDAGVDIFIPNLSEQFLRDLAAKNPGQPFRWGLIGSPKSEEESKAGKGVYLYLPPQEDLLIPTYVHCLLPDNVVLMVTNKSGICTTQKMVVGADTIDPSYQGMIHIHIFNNSHSLRFLECGQKIAQLVPKIFNKEEIEVFYNNQIEEFKEFKNFISVEDFYKDHVSERKSGGFGSTGVQ